MNQPTDPPIHPHIHLSKGGSVSTNHKSSNKIELSRLDQVLLKFLWFHMFQPTNLPIHPPTHQKWVGKSPQIPNLQMESKYLDSFKSYCIFTDLGGTPTWGVGVSVGGYGGLGGGTSHTCVHMLVHSRTCMHMHTHTCMHVKHENMAASMVAAICNFLTCLS